MSPGPSELARMELEGEFIPDVKDTNPKDAIGSAKVPFSTVPMPVIAEVGVAMLEGSCKYARHNYRVAGVRSSVYFDAAMRHLTAWWEGEDIDPDSGVSHITKAIAGLVVLRDAQMQGMVANDDRPPRAREGWMPQLQERVDGILARYPNPLQPYTQAEIAHLAEEPVNVYPGESLGFDIEVQLPAPDAPDGFVWMAQGSRRSNLDQALAVAQALREDGYGNRNVRVLETNDRVVELQDGRHVVDGTLERTVIVAFPGDRSLTEPEEGEEA